MWVSFFVASFVTTVHLVFWSAPEGGNAKLPSVFYFPFSATAPKVARRPLSLNARAVSMAQAETTLSTQSNPGTANRFARVAWPCPSL
jgi:hypothetical protein